MKKTLGIFQIVMINIIAVDSIRALPISAQYGFSLVFYYLIGAIFFFIPSALVSAELGTGWPETGGIYVWVREAFGKKVALVTIWLNWAYNLAWYPTILALIAGTSAYIFNPEMASNKLYIVSITLLVFWLATYANCHGMRISSWISSLSAVLGTLFPMLLIIILGICWVSTGHPSQISFSWESFFPQKDTVNDLAFFSSILFGLLGLEMVATHAAEMKNPIKDYPKATLISVGIILTSLILSSLSIAVVVPSNNISLVVGILQAFSLFWNAFSIPWMTPITAILIILGALGGVSAWVIGPTKGIMVAGKDKLLPRFLEKTNKHGVPTHTLLIQAVIVTLLCITYILMPTVNSSFWLLSIITAQLALVVYIVFFAAAVKLHYHKKEVKRYFKIPGKNTGIWIVCLSGILISFFAICVGFIPPQDINIVNIFYYESLLIGGMIVLSLLPLLFVQFSKKKVH